MLLHKRPAQVEKQIQLDVEMFRCKLTDWIKSGKELVLLPNCELKDDKIMQRCDQCAQLFERTPDCFPPHRNLDNNWDESWPGHENLHSKCRQCVNMHQREVMTREGDPYLKTLLKQYPL